MRGEREEKGRGREREGGGERERERERGEVDRRADADLSRSEEAERDREGIDAAAAAAAVFHQSLLFLRSAADKKIALKLSNIAPSSSKSPSSPDDPLAHVLALPLLLSDIFFLKHDNSILRQPFMWKSQASFQWAKQLRAQLVP